MGVSYTYNFNTDLTANLKQFINRGAKEQAYVDSPALRLLEKRTVTLGSEYLQAAVSYCGTALGGPYVDNTQVSTEDIETATMAQYQPAFYAEPARVSHIQLMKNKGPEARFELWAHKVEQAKMRLRKKLATDYFATSQVTNGITGLPLAIPATTTSGTYGGLNRATYTWWRNYTEVSLGAFATYGTDALDNLINDIQTKTGRKPDYFVTTVDVLQEMQSLARSNFRWDGPNRAGPYQAILNDMAIEHISYAGAPVIADQYCDSGKIYAIRNDAMFLGVFEEFDVTPVIDLGATGVQGQVIFVRWGGQVLTTECRALGQISDVT